MLTLPLIRTDDDSKLTPIERNAIGCENVVTALMMQATISDPTATEQEIETFTTLSVATMTPAEA